MAKVTKKATKAEVEIVDAMTHALRVYGESADPADYDRWRQLKRSLYDLLGARESCLDETSAERIARERAEELCEWAGEEAGWGAERCPIFGMIGRQ